MKNVKDKLKSLVNHMESNRQTGHTTAVIYGAKHVDSVWLSTIEAWGIIWENRMDH
jgi:hypothetical protein